jgi:hypothetical protein
MPDAKPLDYAAMAALVTLAVRMRRAQRACEGTSYNPQSYARKMELQRHFDQQARELLGWAGEIRQPAEVYREQEGKR